MSLVLTSNKSDLNGNTPAGGIDLPYQYHNYLTQPLKLEANSEVAVQSVKLVKNGNVALIPSNNVFYTFTGTVPNTDDGDLDNNDDVDMDFNISAPVMGLITGSSDYGFETLNVETLARRLATGIDSSLCHPNLVKSNIGNGTTVTTLRETTGDIGKFKGFDISINQSNSASNVDTKADLLFFDLLAGNDDYNGSWNATTFRITKLTNKQCDMVATTPISLNGGEFTFNWENAGGGWKTGLVRYVPNIANPNGSQNNRDFENVNPSYFDDEEELLYESFYDYVLISLNTGGGDYDLRLYHTIYDADDEEDVGFRSINFREVEYWNYGPAHASLTGPLPLFDKSASYSDDKTKVRSAVITCENERVKVVVTDGNGLNYTLVDGSSGSGTVLKERMFKPIGLANRFMYPKVYVEDDGNYMTLSKYNGVVPHNFNYTAQADFYAEMVEDSPAILTDENSISYDFCARISDFGDDFTTGLEELSTRKPYDYSAAGLAIDYTQKGLSGSFMSNSSSTFSDLLLSEVQPDADDTFQRVNPTEGANAENIFGFENDPFPTKISASSSSGVTNYKSNSLPLLVSAGSIFVRLDNFNSETYNGDMSNPSKILYHLPRFDTGQNEFGGLFYEPSEKTYIKLNNPAPLYINDFDISLCSSDEKLADNITGKTIIMLHFRKSPL